MNDTERQELLRIATAVLDERPTLSDLGNGRFEGWLTKLARYALTQLSLTPVGTGEVEEIRKRHRDDGIASWPTKTLQDLHTDRATLLRALSACEGEVARLTRANEILSNGLKEARRSFADIVDVCSGKDSASILQVQQSEMGKE